MPQLPVVLAGKSGTRLLAPDYDGTDVTGVNATVLDRSALADMSPLHDLPPISAEDIAYLLFTSGSTGKPKGVPVTHANAVYFMEVMSRRYNITPDDRLSQTFDQTFDLSVFDLFMAWSNGACVYGLSPIDLLSPTKFINTHQLTVWFSVPSVPAQMIRRNTLQPKTLPTLRLSLFCGEPLADRSAELWQQAAPNSVVENLYGPTELTIACFLHRWDAETSPAMCRNGVVPIGRPYDGLAAVVVDGDLRPVPNGEPGELLVNGPQTTPGYWRNPDTTAQRYVTIPVSAHESRRFYRTGDLVAKLDHGEYVFLGRADHQIKVLGHRVELGEIEAALRTHSDVEHAIACGWPQTSSTVADGIVAFVTGNNIDTAALTDIAKRQLPPYVVPKQIFVLNEMPLNANGKVDRRELERRLKTGELAEQKGTPTLA
jgi:amino acid adenylation domain-containing protein